MAPKCRQQGHSITSSARVSGRAQSSFRRLRKLACTARRPPSWDRESAYASPPRLARPGIEASAVLSPPRPRRRAQKNKLIPALKSALILAGSLAHRGRRRSRRWMTERGAVPNNGVAVEPREAQRPTLLGARTPQAADPGNGDIAVGARRAYVTGPPKGAVAQRPGAVASRVYPTCALNEPISGKPEIGRAPFPHVEGNGKQGCGHTRRPNSKNTGGGALANCAV